jgi:hypothetical protein
MSDHYMRRTIRRRPSERGSALLIVFVFAAIIAIMLYREMPVAAFEARRQKEQTLIDRGHEYQRAVQLYYRKFRGSYPANIDMLMNTNNVRFLRHRYTDPFTGKDDWRLLHAGPGGQLMDSKVKRLNLNPLLGQNGSNTNGSAFGSGSGSGFGAGARNGFGTQPANQNTDSQSAGSGAFGNNASDSSSDSDVTVAPLAKRAPPVGANAQGGGSGSTPTGSELDQDPSTPLLPTQDQAAGSPANGGTPQSGLPGAAALANQQAGGGANSMQMVQNLFNSGAGQPQAQTAASALGGGTGIAATTGSTGRITGGAFAGVASKAKGHTIKKVEDQTDYSLWEFWYDPTKDTSMGNTSNLQNGAGGQNLQPGAPGFGTPGVTPSIAPNPGVGTNQNAPDNTGGANTTATPTAPPAQEPQQQPPQ